jgi:hypothetical protein
MGLHPEALSLPSVGALVVALVVGCLLFQITKKLLTALLLMAVTVGLVCWYFDILTLGDAKAAAGQVEQKAKAELEALHRTYPSGSGQPAGR